MTQEQPTPGEVEAWLDRTRFHLQTMRMDSSYRTLNMRRLEQVQDDFAANPEQFDARHIHVWKYMDTASGNEIDRGVRSDTKTVAFDLDGCVYDFATMDTWMIARGYPKPDSVQEKYDYSAHWNVTPEKFEEELRAAVHAGIMFRHGSAYPDGVAAMKRVYGSGHKVLVLSARNLHGVEQQAQAATTRWLRDQGIPFDAIVLSHKKEDVPFDVLIDDHPGNVEKVTATGRRAVLLNRPWNRLEGHGHERGSYSAVVNDLCAPPVQDTLFADSPLPGR